MMAIELTGLHIFLAIRKLGNVTQILPSFSWAIFSHLTRLDQSRASEDIWWIMIYESRISKLITHFHD